MADFSLDIETGPLPMETILPFYAPPASLPPWDDSMVKYGQMKDPVKRAEKYNQVKGAYQAQLDNEKAAIDQHRAQWLSDAALSPVTGQVLAIGLRAGEIDYILGDEGQSEAEILQQFWTVFRKHATSGKFIGFNSNSFDVPFIAWRSYVHSIEIPSSAWDKSGRYPAYCFVDLRDRVPQRGLPADSDGKKRGLSNVCRLLGIGSKPEGVDGGDFARLWAGNEESRQQAIAYLENDLELTAKLAQRMGVI
jgi:hypothetical protein